MSNDIDFELALAAEIRRVDGNHDLGASKLAEKLAPFLRAGSRTAPFPHGALEVMGNIQIDEGGEIQTYYRALVITFDSNEAIRAAIAAEKCTFGFKE